MSEIEAPVIDDGTKTEAEANVSGLDFEDLTCYNVIQLPLGLHSYSGACS